MSLIPQTCRSRHSRCLRVDANLLNRSCRSCYRHFMVHLCILGTLASSLTFASVNIHIFSVLRYDSVFQLLAVVSELKCQGLNILVLGRKHMLQPSKSWDKHNMDLVRQKAYCFFTENMWAPDNLPHRKYIKPSSCCVIVIFCSIPVSTLQPFVLQDMYLL